MASKYVGQDPVRPTAMRAYKCGGGETDAAASNRQDDWTTSTDTSATTASNAFLLQQAACYAPLAQLSAGGASTNTAESSKSYQATQLNGGHSMLQNVTAPFQSSFINNLSEHAIHSTGSHDVDANDVEALMYSLAPRLSMSSAESSSGSEVKTPESISAQPSWRSDELTPATDHAVQRAVASTSPSLFDMSEVAGDPNGLAASGSEQAERLTQTASNSAHVQAASSIDDERESIHRSTTIKPKRPDSLLKLPPHSYQTDRTVTPSTSEPATSRQQSSPTEKSSAHVRASEKAAFEGAASDGDSSSEPYRSPQSDLADVYSFPSLHGESRSGPGSSVLPPQSPPERCAASPDSWRSLLPEHDPYYARTEELVDRSARSGSDALSPSATLSSVRYLMSGAQRDDKAIRRWSNDSRKSSSSLPGPAAGGPEGGLWGSSTSLYDLDGSFNSSGSRAAFAPLQYSYNHSSRSLTSPTASTTHVGAAMDGSARNAMGRIADIVAEQQKFVSPASTSASLASAGNDGSARSAMDKIADIVAEQQKRHASFSTFDNRNAQNRAAFHHAPFVHPDYLDERHTAMRKPASTTGVTPSNIDAKATAVKPAVGRSVLRSDDGRENWPSSRNSLQSLPSPSLSGSSFATSSSMKRNASP